MPSTRSTRKSGSTTIFRSSSIEPSRAEAIGWSWNQGSSLFKPWTWLNLDWSRLFRRIA